MSEYIYYGNQANKVFLTVVESGSIGKAAQKLDVGASAISQQISKLEQELSIRLLQRNAFGVTQLLLALPFKALSTYFASSELRHRCCTFSTAFRSCQPWFSTDHYRFNWHPFNETNV